MAAPAKRADFIAQLNREVRNEAQPRRVRLSANENHQEDILDRALERFNRDSPHLARKAIAGDGTTFEFNLVTAATGWVREWSELRRVRIASTDATERSETILKASDGDYEVELTTDVPPRELLRLLDNTPGTTETLELTYTIPHTIDGTGTTLPTADIYRFMDLAAALAFERMADAAASLLDQETGETSEWGTLVERYQKLADRRMRRYEGFSTAGAATKGQAAGYAELRTEGEDGLPRFAHNLRRRRFGR